MSTPTNPIPHPLATSAFLILLLLVCALSPPATTSSLFADLIATMRMSHALALPHTITLAFPNTITLASEDRDRAVAAADASASSHDTLSMLPGLPQRGTGGCNMHCGGWGGVVVVPMGGMQCAVM